jgi:SWI/SNF related-matrix-associated actin-dependent regulator of chromatin subfamily C
MSIKITMKLETEGVVLLKEDPPAPPPQPYVPPSNDLPLGLIPSCAAWFDPRGIHQLEIDSLPEFFNQKYPSKSPQSYLMFRNYIIKLYRENPKNVLTATTCRRQIPGDACAIIRLHAFLEHWGLINYECPRDYAAPCADFTPVDHISSTRRKVFETGRPFCGYCGKACELTWYKSEDRVLCNCCFAKDLGFDKTAFVRENLLEHFHYADLVKSDAWSEEETANLLQALERHGENWDKIAEELGKSAEECQARFVELPLNDMENLESELKTDYQTPEPDIDFQKAIETATEVRRQEDIHVANLMSQIIDLQMQKLGLKAKYVKDMEHILWLQQQQYKSQLQQLLTSQAGVTVVKAQSRSS